MANQFAGFFTFGFFDSIPEVHCYIVLVVSFVSVVILITVRFIFSVLFRTHILLDRSSIVLQFSSEPEMDSDLFP